jgi:thiol-disulfide isomerase/thioredoxin
VLLYEFIINYLKPFTFTIANQLMLVQTNDPETKEILSKNKQVMLMFIANWCGSCRMFRPKYEKISNKSEYATVRFLILNAEECPEVRKMTQVHALPYFATYLNGNILESGATLREEQVCQMARNLMAAAQ